MKPKHTKIKPKTGAPVNEPVSGTVEPANNGILYKILWYAVYLFVIILFIQQLKPEKKPADKESRVKATFKTFFNGTYQISYENKLLDNPFIKDLKKYKNNYEYNLFDKVNLDNSYKGKEDYIFGEEMTKAYFGDDYCGEAAIKEEVTKAKFVQNKLKEYGIELLILFAPGKSSIYPEMLPDYVLKTKKKTTNYETYVKECKNEKVNFIDFVEIFKELKATSPYPTFSKYGSHWSYYSECVVIDTTIRELEKLMNVNLPNIMYSDIQMKDTALVRDGDILGKIPMEIPKGNILAYPNNIGYEQGPDVTPKKILGIGDSYFRGFFYLGAMRTAFDNSQQWYYNNSIVPENPNNPEVWELDLKAEILKVKAVLIVCNEMNLKNLGNGFIDNAYDLFSDPQKYYLNKKKSDEINTYKKQIRNDKELLNVLTKDAQQRGITLDSLITETALERQREAGEK